MFKSKAPGKLYIAGEYAVVEANHPAIVMAVDRFIQVRIEKSNKGLIKSFGNVEVGYVRGENGLILDQLDSRFSYIISAINVVESYLRQLGLDIDYYSIEDESELEMDGIKIGLGSSAAITVATVEALLKYYGISYDEMLLFKLASIASVKINPKGSGGDIAASSFGSLIYYNSYDRKKLRKRLDNESVYDLVNSKWDNLVIEKINIPEDMKILIGWTRSPASSIDLVSNAKSEIRRDEKFYREFLARSKSCVNKLKKALEEDDYADVKYYIEKNRTLLREFSNKYKLDIENEKLTDLCNIAKESGAAAKTSGAGGGDCGIAIIDETIDVKEISRKWKEKQIETLDLNIWERR